MPKVCNKTWAEEAKDFLTDVLVILAVAVILVVKVFYLILWPISWLERLKFGGH